MLCDLVLFFLTLTQNLFFCFYFVLWLKLSTATLCSTFCLGPLFYHPYRQNFSFRQFYFILSFFIFFYRHLFHHFLYSPNYQSYKLLRILLFLMWLCKWFCLLARTNISLSLDGFDWDGLLAGHRTIILACWLLNIIRNW